MLFDAIISKIRQVYNEDEGFIPLHSPTFIGKEREYAFDCIESTFVSSVGKYVDRFEGMISEYTGSKYAVATVNGTSALHTSLMLFGCGNEHEVLTQAISFVATANAITYCGARPIFLDCDKHTMGLSPEALERFILENCYQDVDGNTINKKTGKRIIACVPVHVFGHPVRIAKIRNICKKHGITIIEDAAESLGSLFEGKHTGTFGDMGILSFNGNKIITTGGGGVILTNSQSTAQKAKHIITTAKTRHPWEYNHDVVGYNYRMPNINAALGCAQLELLPAFIDDKRQIAEEYEKFFKSSGIRFISEPPGSRSNYWLNSILFENRTVRDSFLEYTNARGVMTRPLWTLISELPMYKDCQKGDLATSKWLADRLVNIPSGARLDKGSRDKTA